MRQGTLVVCHRGASRYVRDVSSLFHDLDNAMQVLKTAVTMLPLESSDGEKLAWIDMIQDAADRCHRLLARLESEPEEGIQWSRQL